MNDCVFCNIPLSDGQPTATLMQKGCAGIMKACEARGSDITVTPGQTVHIQCRSEFTNPKSIQLYLKRKHSGEQEQQLQQTLRSEESSFSYKYDCIFCGCPDMYKGKKAEHKLIPVRTMDFQHKIIKVCDQFKG